MRRRKLLGALGCSALGGLAGCLFNTPSWTEPPLPDNRPDAVYVPSHVQGMEVPGTQSSGSYRCLLSYTVPHRFWLVTSSRKRRVDIEADDSLHLMAVVWDTETGIVPTDINPQMSVTRNGESVTELAPWPMLSQRMGFHFGDNVGLDGNGTYQVEVSIGSPSIRRTGSLADNQGQTSFTFELDFQEAELLDVMLRDIPLDEEGTNGAVDPMSMEMLPSTSVPRESDLSGTVRGTATSSDAQFVVTTLPDATPFGGSENQTYLAVSPRTPYNHYVLPMMALSGTLSRGGETIYDGALQPTIDPDLHYHYGAVVSDVESDDELTIAVDSPPQTARHEGYEKAFFEMDDMTISL